MLSGPIVKALLTIALPIMVMNVMQSLFNIIDMTVLKSYESDITVGAVGTCGTLISTITGLMIGISSGANVIIAKHIGAGDKERVERAIGTAVLVAVTGGIALAVIGLTCAEVFLGWINCPATLLKDAALRGMGRPMVAMVSTLIFMCAIRFVWVYLIFTPLRDSLANPLTFLYLIWPIGWILSISFQLCFFFPTVKKLKKKLSASEAEAV